MVKYRKAVTGGFAETVRRELTFVVADVRKETSVSILSDVVEYVEIFAEKTHERIQELELALERDEQNLLIKNLQEELRDSYTAENVERKRRKDVQAELESFEESTSKHIEKLLSEIRDLRNQIERSELSNSW